MLERLLRAALLAGWLAAAAMAAARAEPVGGNAEGACAWRYMVAVPGALPAPVCIRNSTHFAADVCGAIEMLAGRHGLPPGFFARLIWQESRFDPNAVSPAGAEGIAQFIPSTARLRALDDPFNPAEALARSARYLAEMSEEFGSLGLAAIGYNAGEDRARRFLAGQPFMPGETRHYVHLITGHSVEQWRDDPPETVDFALAKERPFTEACLDLARNSRMSELRTASADWKPWGVQLGSHFSRASAEQIFTRVQARFDVLAGESPMFVAERNRSRGSRARTAVRIGRDTREESQELCSAIRRAGGFCLVVRN